MRSDVGGDGRAPDRAAGVACVQDDVGCEHGETVPVTGPGAPESSSEPLESREIRAGAKLCRQCLGALGRKSGTGSIAKAPSASGRQLGGGASVPDPDALDEPRPLPQVCAPLATDRPAELDSPELLVEPPRELRGRGRSRSRTRDPTGATRSRSRPDDIVERPSSPGAQEDERRLG